MLGEDRRRRLEVRLPAPLGPLLGDDLDAAGRASRAGTPRGPGRSGCRRAGDHGDLAAVGQRLVELLTPGVAEGADVAAAVGEVVGARLADLAGRPRHHLGALVGGGPVGGDQRLAGVGERQDHVVALGGEAAHVGDRLLRVEVGVGVADLADLRVRERLEDELHLEDLAGDVAAEPVGEADLELAAGAGVAAVLLPALAGPGPRRPGSTPGRSWPGRRCAPAPPPAATRRRRAPVEQDVIGGVVLAVLAVVERRSELVGAAARWPCRRRRCRVERSWPTRRSSWRRR